MLVGGIAENFDGSYRIGGGREFVIEGDEYDSAFFDKTAKFLKYLPDIAVVGNIEFDHADIYADLNAIRLTFQRFVNLIPRRGLLLLGADNPDALALRTRAHCRVETFGLADGSDWQAHDLSVKETSTSFGVRRAGATVGTFEVPLLGAYNVRNALAAIAVGAAVGLSTDTMAASLKRFKGVRRRMQHRGTVRGIAVYDDFAHHPTAIGETLAGVRSAYPNRRIWAIFEPRSATSCRRVFQADFARALSKADRVILPAVFRSTLPEAERLSDRAAGGRPRGRRASMRATSQAPTTSSRPSRARPARATSWSSCRTAASTTSIGSCCLRSSGRAERVDAFVQDSSRQVKRRWSWSCPSASIPSSTPGASPCRERSCRASAPSFATSSSATARSPSTSIRCESTRRGSRLKLRASAETLDVETAAEGALIDVPVCYGGDLGPDLADVAAFAGVFGGRSD